MDKQYKDRNVDLPLLSKWIERFFLRKEFRAAKEAQEGGYRIVAQPTYVHDIVDKTTVFISGNSNDFTVKFYTGARSEALMKLGRLTSLFGGGVLFLRGIKSDEAEEKLERSFWSYVEEKIDYLTNSVAKAEESVDSDE